MRSEDVVAKPPPAASQELAERSRVEIGFEHDLFALYDRQEARALENRLEAIKSVSTRPESRLMKGAPVRGTRIEIGLDESGFSSEGEMYLFASLLEEFFRLYVSINSFSHLVVDALQSGERYDWPPKIGQQIIL